MKKLKKIEEDSQEFRRMAIALALSNIQIAPCQDCGGAVQMGYCCGRCGSTSPMRKYQEPVSLEA